MHHYELHFCDEEKVHETASFDAYSLAGALDAARKRLHGQKAKLTEDGRPICSLELVEGTGVWLVGGPD